MEKILEWDKKNLLKKIILAALIILLVCFLDVYYVIYQVVNFKSIGALFTVDKSINTIVNIGLLVAVVGLVCISLDYYLYPKKRLVLMKLMSLISFVGSLFLFIPFSKIQIFRFLVLPINWYPFIAFITFFILVAAIISTILLFRGKEIMINGAVEFLKSIFFKVKDVVIAGYKKAKTLVSKYKKIFIGITCLLLACTSVFIVTQYVIKTPVDVFDGVELIYQGVTGDGVATVDKSNIKTTDDTKINSFLNEVTYKMNNMEELENDQIITVTAVVSSERMKELRISVDQLTKDFTVTGLSTIPQSKAEIPNIEKLDNILLTELQKGYTSSNNTRTIELAKTCYTTSPESSSHDAEYGTFVNIYKVVDTFTSSYSDPRVEEEYKVKGYTGLTINPKGELGNNYSSYSPRIYSMKSLDEAEMLVKKDGLECY